MDNTIVLDKTVDAAQTAVDDSVKFHVNNLELYYKDFHALKRVSMDIPQKKITAFIGPSGKSTFLKTLNRMNDLVEGCRITGDVQLNGEDIYGDMDVNHLRKRVGMVFQNPNPFPMSIYDNVAYGPRNQGIKDNKILDKIYSYKRSLYKDISDYNEIEFELNKSCNEIYLYTLNHINKFKKKYRLY